MDLDRKKELAFLYLQGEMEPEDKQTVFDLILRDETFRMCLKQELELKRRMKSLRTSMLPDVKARLYAEITRRAVDNGELPEHFDAAQSSAAAGRLPAEGTVGFREATAMPGASSAPAGQTVRLVRALSRIVPARRSGKSPAWLLWSEWTLRQTIPPLVYPLIKFLQRRCLI